MAILTSDNSGKNDHESPAHVRTRRYFTGLIVLSSIVFLFGLWGVFNTIYSPFVSDSANGNATLFNADSSRLALTLQSQDTDGDGLTDYEELYVYNTSPYLKDSDSDGIDDKTEIDQGTDPNCPQGQTCGRVTTNTNNTNAIAAELNINETNASVDFANLSASDLRQALLNAGAPKTELDQIDDTTLLAMHHQLLAEQAASASNTNSNLNLNLDLNQSQADNTNVSLNANAGGNTNATNVSIPSGLTLQSLENLTPAEIRTLLVASGASADSLNNIDDTTLKTLYIESLNELKTGQ